MPALTARDLLVAQWHWLTRLAEKFGERGAGKRSLDLRHGVIETAVQWAEVRAVRLEVERAGRDPLQRIDRVDDVKNRQHAGICRQRDSTTNATLRMNNICFRQTLQHLRQIGRRHLGYFCQLLRRATPGCHGSQVDDSAEGVFDGLGDHGANTKAGQ